LLSAQRDRELVAAHVNESSLALNIEVNQVVPDWRQKLLANAVCAPFYTSLATNGD
jgi:hypothetical protein